MPSLGRAVERREVHNFVLKMDATSRSNELLRDGLMPFYGREVERR
jgi:hypothetical protein